VNCGADELTTKLIYTLCKTLSDITTCFWFYKLNVLVRMLCLLSRPLQRMFIRMLCLLCRPLQRMVVGMLLAACAFVIAGILQLKIDVSFCLCFQRF